MVATIIEVLNIRTQRGRLLKQKVFRLEAMFKPWEGGVCLKKKYMHVEANY